MKNQIIEILKAFLVCGGVAALISWAPIIPAQFKQIGVYGCLFVFVLWLVLVLL